MRNPLPPFDHIHLVSIELSNVCNMVHQHSECPLHMLDAPTTILETETVKEVLRELGAHYYDRWLTFNGYNEPLLDPRFYYLCDLAHAHMPRLKIRVITNGTFLDVHVLRDLRLLGVRHVHVSLYGTKEQREEKYLFYKGMTETAGIDDLAVETPLPAKSGFADLRSIYDRQLGRQVPCYALDWLYINCKGQLRMCCADWQDRNSFGDLQQQKLHEILEGVTYQTWRKTLEGGGRTVPPCVGCMSKRGGSL